jgi:hypothetical protein
MSLWKQMNQSSVRENITEASQLMVRGFWWWLTPARRGCVCWKSRDEATLLPLIKQFTPGSTLYGYRWSAYQNIERHMPEFIRVTGVHIEHHRGHVSGRGTQERETTETTAARPSVWVYLRRRTGIRGMEFPSTHSECLRVPHADERRNASSSGNSVFIPGLIAQAILHTHDVVLSQSYLGTSEL